MGLTGIIVFVVITLIAVVYLYTMNRLNKLDSAARNRAGDLDALIWDRNHVYQKITKFLEEHEVSLEEDLTKPLSLAIGMPVSLQMSTYTELHHRWNRLLPILDEHPELKEDPDLVPLLERFDSIRTEIIKASSVYNRSATEFNGYIEKTLPGMFASRKGKVARSFFNVELAEVSAK